MLENLPEMNLNDDDADSASSGGSDIEILPLDFRTAMVNGKLVIQAKPKEYKSTTQSITKGDKQKIEDDEDLDPDKAIGDVYKYLKSVRKDAFDITDPNVVMIDPDRQKKKTYSDVLLPCEIERLENNFMKDDNDQNKINLE